MDWGDLVVTILGGWVSLSFAAAFLLWCRKN